MNLKTQVRFAEPNDLDDLIILCKAHAYYEQIKYQANGKALALKQHLFKPNPSLFCLVIEHNHKLIGYATYMKQFSTWDCDFYLYMDCLFLHEEFRDQGIERRIMNKIQQQAIKFNISFLQWQAPEFNKEAIQFYKNLGAKTIEKERFLLKIDR